VRRAETIGRPLVSAASNQARNVRNRPARPQAEGEAWWSGSWLFEEQPMLIEAGFDVAFECPATTPMILQLSIHPSRDADQDAPIRRRCAAAARLSRMVTKRRSLSLNWSASLREDKDQAADLPNCHVFTLR
jgi:hypothetical protein